MDKIYVKKKKESNSLLPTPSATEQDWSDDDDCDDINGTVTFTQLPERREGSILMIEKCSSTKGMLNYQKEPKIHSDLKLSNHCQSESTVISQKTTNDPDQKEKKVLGRPGKSWDKGS